jgi:hypothetical protein
MSMHIPSHSELVLQQMYRDYSLNDCAYYKKIQDFLNGKYGFSIRDLEWFTVTYCRLHNVCYELNGQPVLLYEEYKRFMMSKKLFDQFARGERISFSPSKDLPPITTTVGQLNYFASFVFRYKVLEYMKENREAIKKAMELEGPKTRKKAGTVEPGGTQRRRRRLVVEASSAVRKHNIEVTVKFGE